VLLPIFGLRPPYAGGWFARKVGTMRNGNVVAGARHDTSLQPPASGHLVQVVLRARVQQHVCWDGCSKRTWCIASPLLPLGFGLARTGPGVVATTLG